MLTFKNIAKIIDHSLLKPQLIIDDVIGECKVAKKCGVVPACVKLEDVLFAKD